MKVAIINISDKIGGAAIAGYRIAKALEKYYGTDNFFLVRTKSLNENRIYSTTSTPFIARLERLFNILMNILGLQYIYLPFSPWYILKKVKEEKPDVIHLHNPIGGFFMTGHLTTLSRMAPVVWTLHDMWAFTASAAHTFGDDAWKYMRSTKNETRTFPHIGINTGEWLIRRKKKIYSRSNLRIVAPSRWLYNLARQSPVLEGKEIFYIPHGIDLQKFVPKDKKDLRKNMGLPEDAKVLIFIAQKISNNAFKGGNDLSMILEKLNSMSSNAPIHVLLLGEDNNAYLSKFKNLKVHPLGYIKEEEKIIDALNTADLFLYPTRADNLPLVLIESIACGTPCVTFDIGGCGDMIKDGYNGYLIKDMNLDEAAEKTFYLLNDKTLLHTFSINARRYAEDNFSEAAMAEGYFRLFEKVIDNNLRSSE